MSWRVGRKVGRTVYDGDTLIGVMDTPELAAKVVAAVNAASTSGSVVQIGVDLIVQIGVGHGCWSDVKEPRLHDDNSVSYLGSETGIRFQTKPGNWRSNGPVPLARESDAALSVYERV